MAKKKEPIVREPPAASPIDRDMLILQLVIACEDQGKRPTRDQVAQVLSRQNKPFQMDLPRVIAAITSLRQTSVAHLHWFHDDPLTSTERGRAAAEEVAQPPGFEALVEQLLRCIEAGQRITTSTISGGVASKPLKD